MRIVLLSGGSGKRLWPLSNDWKSKPFLRVMQDQHGRKLSMIQHTMQELDQLSEVKSTLVVASAKHIHRVQEHLGKRINCLIEPEQRDTFPAVALAVAYLHNELGVSRDEPIVVMPVDGQADPSFYQHIVQLAQAIAQPGVAKLGLIGVQPSGPSVKYGYILPDEKSNQRLRAIHRFQEKPDEATARKLIEGGALWNCGIFAFTAGYLLDWLLEHGCSTDYQTMLRKYGELPARSFDYEVVEHELDAACMRYTGPWTDMGTWDAIAESMNTQIYGNALLDGDCQDTNVINELPMPIVVSDIRDVVIVAGQEGILISSKGSSPDIKKVVDRLNGEVAASAEQTGRPGRRLDQYKLKDGSGSVHTTRIRITAGDSLTVHPRAVQTVWTVTEGLGLTHAGGNGNNKEFMIGQGQSVTFRDDGRLTAQEDCMLIEVATFLETEPSARFKEVL